MDDVQKTISAVSSSMGGIQQLFTTHSGDRLRGMVQQALQGKQYGGAAAQQSGGQPINLVMHINTQNADSFRRSQGQIMAEAATALQRAMRNL